MKKPSALAAALVLLAVTSAHAASPCTQAKLAGRWQIYALAFDAEGVEGFRCAVAVKRTGAMAGKCVLNDGTTAAMSTAGLKMTTPAKCTFTGKFKLDGVLYGIKHGTLALDLKTAYGAGGFTGGRVRLDMLRLP